MLVPPVPYQPTTGLITYNHLAYLTSNTQFSANLAVSNDQPTQAMMNDYAATVPKLFPHTCSLCNTYCTNMQDWISHQNASFHLENCKQLCKTYPWWDGGIGSRSRHESPSPSKSPNSHRRRDSEGRRDRRRSRSRSDRRSRHHHSSRAWSRSRSRSRSPSTRYRSRISSRHQSHSRSSERQSSPRRSDRRESTPRRSRERRLPPRRKRERRSPTQELSPERERESSAEKLARKLLETSVRLGVQSQSSPSDREAVVQTLAPALMAELAKRKSSSSGRGQKRSSSPLSAVERDLLPPPEIKLQSWEAGISAGGKERRSADKHGASKPPTSSAETHVKQSALSVPALERGCNYRTDASAEHASKNARNVRAEEASAERSSTAVTPLTPGEMVEKLLDPSQIRFISVKTCFQPKFLKQNNKQLLISKLPKDGFYKEEDVARLLTPFGFHYSDDKIFVLPQVCLAFVLMPKPEHVCNVLHSVSRVRFSLKGTALWVNVVSEKQMMSPLGLYMKLMELMKSPVSDEGAAVIYIKKIPPREAKDLREDMKDISFKNFLPLLNKVFIEFESHYNADQFEHWYCHLHPGRSQNICKLDKNKCPYLPKSDKKMDGASGIDAQKAGSNPRAVTTKEAAASLAAQPAAAGKTVQKMKASILYSTDGTPLSRGEMVEHLLCKERIECLPEESCISPQFLVGGSKLLLLTELPAFDVYTEADVAKVLTPFGFQFKEDTIYVVPQARMAFIQMGTAEEVQKIMKTHKGHPLVLLEAKLCLDVVTGCPDTSHLEFYKFLMGLLKYPVTDEGGRTVLIRNISQSEIEDLRVALKKIGSVRNVLPLLNKVFIEFDSVRDADRLGVWYSFLKRATGHQVQRLKVPTSGCTSQAPRHPTDALPDNKDVMEGATVPPEDTVVPQGSTPPFWLTMRNSPFVFPTTSPWFSIPRFQTVKAASDITSATGSTTVMLTGLPSGYYKHEDVAKLVWPYFCHQNLCSLYYSVIVLQLQRRAFVFFTDKEACSHFLQDYLARPLLVKGKAVKVHIVLEHMEHETSEVTMYKSLMKWSNAGVPDSDSLEERLLCVRIREVSVELVLLVLEVVAVVAPFVNFLPLANRICIEMADPSGVTKVLEKRNSLCPVTNEKMKAWEKVVGFETVKNLEQRLQASSKTSTTVKMIDAKVDTELPASDCPTERPPSEPLDSGSQSALQTSHPDGSTAGPSPTANKEGENPGTEVAIAAAGSNSNEDVKKPSASSPDLPATALMSEEDLDKFYKVDADSLHALYAAVGIHKRRRVSRSNNMDNDEANSTSSPRTGSSSSAQERENINSKETVVDASVETHPEQLTEGEVAMSAHKVSAEGAAAESVESETEMETSTTMKRNNKEGKKDGDETDKQMGDGDQVKSSKTQTTGPKESPTLHEECLQISDGINDERKAQTEASSEMEMDCSFQGQDSHMVEEDGSIVKQQLSEENDKPEVDKSKDKKVWRRQNSKTKKSKLFQTHLAKLPKTLKIKLKPLQKGLIEEEAQEERKRRTPVYTSKKHLKNLTGFRRLRFRFWTLWKGRLSIMD
nr:uncharacterized protein LOC109998353 [Labrus bergylta]